MFLRKPIFLVLTTVLVVQASVFYTMPRNEIVPEIQPLSALGQRIGPWTMTRETELEQEVLDLLKADDTLSRDYAGTKSARSVNLFIAFFKTQRAGQQPHSPKVCLPGSGWTPERSGVMELSVAGRPDPITVNRYIVARGERKSMVSYWYQTRDRVVASEYSAKVFTILDSIRYRRSDTALVRVVVPFMGGDEAEAERISTEFIHDVFTPVRQILPR